APCRSLLVFGFAHPYQSYLLTPASFFGQLREPIGKVRMHHKGNRPGGRATAEIVDQVTDVFGMVACNLYVEKQGTHRRFVVGFKYLPTTRLKKTVNISFIRKILRAAYSLFPSWRNGIWSEKSSFRARWKYVPRSA